MLDDDFTVGPQRAPDPSVEEMLRRARDARLDDSLGAAYTNAPHFRPFAAEEEQPALGRWLRDCALLVIGVLLGALVACIAFRAGTLVSSVTTPLQTTTQNTSATTAPATAASTAGPLLTPTNTPVATPKEVPAGTADPGSSSPPTIGETVTLAQDFYDNQSSVAGRYVLVDVTSVQVQSQDETQIHACLAFDFAFVASPDTVAGADMRLFILTPDSNGSWQVVQMGGSDSCSLT